MEGRLDGVICGSCLEFKKDKSEDIENNISIFSIHKNILERYSRNYQLLPLEKKTRELKRLFIIRNLILSKCVLFIHFINICA